MKYTIKPNGDLLIQCSPETRKNVLEYKADYPEKWGTLVAEWEVLEPLLCNSDLDWCQPEEVGALTSAPMLCIRGEENAAGESEILKCWGFMDYQVRSFCDDLADKGETTFQAGSRIE